MEAGFTLTGVNSEAFLFQPLTPPPSFTTNELMEHQNQCCEYNFMSLLSEINVKFKLGVLGQKVCDERNSKKCPSNCVVTFFSPLQNCAFCQTK